LQFNVIFNYGITSNISIRILILLVELLVW